MFGFIFGMFMAVMIGLAALACFVAAFDRSREGFVGDFSMGLLAAAWALLMCALAFDSEVGKNDTVVLEPMQPVSIVTNDNSLAVFYHNEKNGDAGVIETSEIADYKSDKLFIREIAQHNINNKYLSSKYEIVNAEELKGLGEGK
jgi:hypothetical protein